ncbi:MAG: WHG domain-containing protein [Alphaproteobacteria bacterium]|nr:WHG domain-containing protein [Alphaproteobacteria bacterium]
MARAVKPTKRGYHHGDLPEALAKAAEALVREAGASGFSLRECARRAGVAHSAPGHHFGDAGGLLTEVAARGFDRLTARMRERRGDAEGPEALQRIGMAYVDFALSDPAVLQLMFHSDRVDCDNARFKRAGEAAFGELVSAVASTTGRPSPDEGTLRFAWSAVHGVSTLLINGQRQGAAAARRANPLALAEGTIRRTVHAVRTFRG